MSRENGIDTRGLIVSFRAIILGLCGYGNKRVFFVNGAADQPRPMRPFISLKLLDPETPLRASDDRTFHAKPYWRVVVFGTFTGAQFDLTIVDTVYSYTALLGDSLFDVRDALVALAAADPNATVTATGSLTASIDIEGLVGGVNLPVAIGQPSVMLISKFRSALVTTICRPVTSTIEVMIWGRLGVGDPNNNSVTDPDFPTPEDTASHMAGILLGGLLHKDITLPMRELGHIPKLVSGAEDLSGIFRDEYEDVSRLEVDVETTLSFAKFSEVVTEMTATNESAQLP